jgi:N-acetyl-anhydromuramyl-L-alanine amidase AmpD
MSDFLVVCGQKVKIDRRVVSFLEPGAPNFYLAAQELGRPLYSRRPGVPEGSDYSVLRGKVRQILIHHDATWSSLSCFRVLKKRGFSTHLMVDTDGTIYQALDIRDNAWHGGDVNEISVGLDMNNVGSRDLLETDRGLKYMQNGRGGRLFQRKINNGAPRSAGYTDEQYRSLVAIIKGLHKILPSISLFPPLDRSGEVIGRKIQGHRNFRGWLGHWHVSAGKWDPGPGFDWQRVMIGIHGERNSMPVDLANVPSLADVFSGPIIRQVAEKYYLNVEGRQDGFYPVSVSQAWHSGVHFAVDPRQPIRCMSKGEIVAVRNRQHVELGSANFVLVRHKVRASPDAKDPSASAGGPAPAGGAPEESFVEKLWFSLYMHLQYISPDTDLGTRPAWYKLLGRDEVGNDPRIELDDSELTDRRPKVGKDFRDLRAGKVVLMNLEVSAGEIIGYAGEFGSTTDDVRPTVHVETISSEAGPLFDPTQFPEVWKLIEADTDNESLADLDQIWRPILDDTNFIRGGDIELRRGQRILTPSEIREFFDGTSIDKLSFRGYVCRHVSEWSDKLDWSKTAAVAVGWQWQTRAAFDKFLRLWSPFMWMNDEVIEHAGLDKERRVWTYHPVTLIAWLHENYGRQLSPEEYQVGFSNEGLRVEVEKEVQLALTTKTGWHGEAEADLATLDDVGAEGLQLDNEPWKLPEQGEWGY